MTGSNRTELPVQPHIFRNFLEWTGAYFDGSDHATPSIATIVRTVEAHSALITARVQVLRLEGLLEGGR